MDTDKLNTVSFLFIIAIVFFVEAAIPQLAFKPLIATGVSRCLEIALILLVLVFLNAGPAVIGLSRDRIVSGIQKGFVWSAVFGLLAALCGAVLFFLRINPFQLLHVGLPHTRSEIIWFYIVGGFIAPVAEEIFFRGVIYGYVKGLFSKKTAPWSISAALIVSTYLFVIAHQTNAGIPLPQLAGGVVFCISYEIEKSLMTPIVIHALGNLALFTVSFFL